MKSRSAFRSLASCLTALAALLLLMPALAHAAGTSEHVFKPGANGTVQPAPDAATLTGPTASFSVSPDHLRATRQGSKVQLGIQIDARPGQDVDLRKMTTEQFLVYLNQVLLQANQNLLERRPAAEARQLAPFVPDSTASGRRTARATVQDDAVDVTLDLSAGKSGGPDQVEAPAQLDFLAPDVSSSAAETCSGVCDNFICICSGSFDCCAVGCAICFAV